MRFRSVDIETIPDPSVWTVGEPQYKVMPHERVIATYESPFQPIGAQDVTIQQIGVRAVANEPFPPPQAHRVVAISTVDVDLQLEDPSHPRAYRFAGCASDCKWDYDPKTADAFELLLLRRFSDAVSEEIEKDDLFTLVTWNGRGFDLPVMSMRSLKLGVPWGWYYTSKGMRYRYGAEGHLDLMDFLGDFGAAKNMKLSDVARLIGLPGKTDMTGASVAGMYEEGRKDSALAESMKVRVRRYCLQDTLQTALIFLRTRFHLGKIDAKGYDESVASFSDSEDVRAAIDINWKMLEL
jgi:hypothetical protein